MKVSHSGMACFRECPHKFYLSRIENIQPVETGRALGFGNAMHSALAAIWEGREGWASWWVEACKEYNLSSEDQILGILLLKGYIVRYKIPEGAKVEEHFDVGVLNPMGYTDPHFTFQGYVDAETPDYVLDHKTTSSNITPTYLKKLHRSPQAEEYLIAAQDRGSKATYAIWDIIKSNAVPRRTATPEHEREFYKRKGKYGDVGDPKPGTYLQDETWEEYEQRIVDMIAADPDTFYVREEIHKTEEELDRRRYDIWATAKQIEMAKYNEAWPRNEAGCDKYGGCEYAPICWDGVDPAQSELYTIGQKRGR